MGGGLIQLVTLGYEDLYLTTDPEVTFFKRIYNPKADQLIFMDKPVPRSSWWSSF